MRETSDRSPELQPQLESEDDEQLGWRQSVSPGKLAPTQRLGWAVQRSASGAEVSDSAATELAAARGSGGAPLPAAARAKFEDSLGADLSAVRVHTDGAADRAATAMGARAFAHGSDVFFASSQYDPGSPSGEQLLAHEVAHTVQQGGAQVTPQPKLRVSERGDPLEVEADAAAAAMVAGEPAAVSQGAAPSIARSGPEDAPPEPTRGLDASMLEFTGPDFQIVGTVHANREAGSDGDVRVESTSIGYTSNVSLRSTVHLAEGQSIEVGPIQTMTSSDRRGIYRRPDGSIAAEYRSAPGAGNHRDAPLGDDGRAAVPAPWYWAPSSLTEGTRSASVPFRDQPRFVIPREMSGGRLAETRGSETFVTSLSAKRDSTVIHLSSMQWTVPWDMQISDEGQGTGGDIQGRSQTQGAPAADGPVAGEAAQEWYHFSDLAAARAAGWQTLVRAAAGARQHDPESSALIVQALRELNPAITVNITCVREFSNFGADDISMHASGHSGYQYTDTFSLRQGGIHTLRFNLLSVFDVNRIDDSARISFNGVVSGVADTMPISASWPFPFNTVENVNMAGSNRTYTIGGSVA